jgi:hypothetical protein
MTSAIIFNILMILGGVGIATGVVPAALVAGTISVLHKIIGITTPPPNQLRVVALIWIGSVIVIVDGMLALTVFLTYYLK